MDDKLTPIEKLDFVLKYFVEMDKPPFKRSGEIKDALGYELSKEMFEIFHKLEKEGYITTDTLPMNGLNTVVYGSTFDGKLFYLSGGYAAKSLNDENDAILTQLEIVRQRTLDGNSERNQRRLNQLTLWLAVGSFALLAWQFFLYIYPVHKDYPCWIWDKDCINCVIKK
jgi:hypothetical protein